MFLVKVTMPAFVLLTCVVVSVVAPWGKSKSKINPTINTDLMTRSEILNMMRDIKFNDDCKTFKVNNPSSSALPSTVNCNLAARTWRALEPAVCPHPRMSFCATRNTGSVFGCGYEPKLECALVCPPEAGITGPTMQYDGRPFQQWFLTDIQIPAN